MEKVKDFFSNKKHIYITGAILILLLALIIGLIIIISVNKRYPYATVEKNMVKSAKEYLAQYPELKPDKTNLSIDLDTDLLISEEYLKPFDKLSNDSNCHGIITVTYNHDELAYLPKLTCDNYKTVTLREIILKNNPVTAEEDGLYLVDGAYRFKGDYVNNYFSFANKLWRIYKITDNKFFLILADTVNDKNSEAMFDDRYNEEAESYRGKSDFEASRIKENLLTVYNDQFVNYKAYILDHNACVHTRSEIDTDKSGAIECDKVTSVPISLLPVFDYISASRDPICLNTVSQNCSNYNYLSKTKNRWWLLNGTNEYSYKVYSVSNHGYVELLNANTKRNLRYVITISDTLNYKSGNGTESKPYEIYEY